MLSNSNTTAAPQSVPPPAQSESGEPIIARSPSSETLKAVKPLPDGVSCPVSLQFVPSNSNMVATPPLPVFPLTNTRSPSSETKNPNIEEVPVSSAVLLQLVPSNSKI